MVRGKALDQNLKEMIISEYKKMGKSYQQISRIIGVARTTVHSVIKKYEESMSINTRPKYGCPRKTNMIEDLSLQRVVEMNPFDSIVDIKKKWEIEIKKPVSMTTCRRRLHDLGIELSPRLPKPTHSEIIVRTDKRKDERIDEQTNGWIDRGWTDGWMDGERIDGCTHEGRTDGWTDGRRMDNHKPPFQSIREPEVNIYAEEDKIPQRPGSSLLEEQSFDTESRQDNNENKYQEHHHQTKRRKSKRSSNSKKRAKNSATVQATLDSLQTVTKAISAQHDEFSLFGEYMAMSLRTMPMRNALRCKEKLLSVIVNERLNVGSENI